MSNLIRLKDQIIAEFRKSDDLHLEFLEFGIDLYDDKEILSITDRMGWMTINIVAMLDEYYKAGVIFSRKNMPFVLVE